LLTENTPDRGLPYTTMPSTQTHQIPACPACACRLTVKKGVRRNRLQTLQVFRCTECLHRFTGAAGKNKTYPLHIILESVSTFNLGYSLTETQRIMRNRFHRNIPERTISSWLNEYRPLSTYSRLRLAGRRLFQPDTLIRSHTFHHQQVYRFQLHRVRLDLLTQSNAQLATHNCGDITSLKEYLASIETHFPHHLFQDTGHRSSKFPAELNPPINRKENHATRTAALVLPTSPNNKRRHETLQRFMLANDSVTIAVEVPVFLTKEDIALYRTRGFDQISRLMSSLAISIFSRSATATFISSTTNRMHAKKGTRTSSSRSTRSPWREELLSR
jgi:transposase-like protein